MPFWIIGPNSILYIQSSIDTSWLLGMYVCNLFLSYIIKTKPWCFSFLFLCLFTIMVQAFVYRYFGLAGKLNKVSHGIVTKLLLPKDTVPGGTLKKFKCS